MNYYVLTSILLHVHLNLTLWYLASKVVSYRQGHGIAVILQNAMFYVLAYCKLQHENDYCLLIRDRANVLVLMTIAGISVGKLECLG